MTRSTRAGRDDVAAMFYTSGHDRQSQGRGAGYSNLLAAGRAGADMEGLTIGRKCWPTCRWRGSGRTSSPTPSGWCAASPSIARSRRPRCMADLREIGPTYYFAPPRVLEALLTQVMIRMEDASAIKRRVFHYFMDVARRVGGRLLDGQPVGAGDRLALRTRRLVRLRAAAQCTRHEPDTRGLHGRAKRSGRTFSPSTARSAST